MSYYTPLLDRPGAVASPPEEESWSGIQVSRLNGVSVLSSCKNVSPLKILSPRALSDCCQVILSNYGGGLVAGDEIRLKIECGPYSKLYLGTQAETKIYKSFDGKKSSQTIMGELGPHALAVICPDALIPYKESKFYQRQLWKIDSTSALILVDWFHAGRSALGEDFQCDVWSSEVAIVRNEKKLILDRLKVRPESSSPFLTGAFGEYKSYFSVYLLGNRCGPLVDALREFPFRLETERIFCALNHVNEACTVFRALAKEKQELFPILERIFGVLERPELLGYNPLRRKH